MTEGMIDYEEGISDQGEGVDQIFTPKQIGGKAREKNVRWM